MAIEILPPRTIQLTHNLETIVDDEDFDFLNQWKWHAKQDHNTWYARRGFDLVYMHRILIDSTELVDHINRNGLDNRKSNLRSCSSSQNAVNSEKQSSSVYTSKYKGVRKHTCGKWQARATLDGKTIHLGLFEVEEDAAKAYDKIMKLHYKDFVRTNF